MKNNLLVTLILTSFIACLLPSCTHYYYGPNSNNIPVLEKKGDGRISGSFAIADETSGFEFQSAYALSNHFATMFNFYYADSEIANSSGNYSSNDDKGNGTYAELAAGYFTPLKKDDTRKMFEVYGGFGTGSINNQYERFSSSKVGITKYFIQPSIGITSQNEKFQFAFASKISYVKLKVKNINQSGPIQSIDLQELQAVNLDGAGMYWEPGLIFRYGMKNLKLQYQTTFSVGFKNHDYETQGGLTSLGIIYSFNHAKK